MKNKSKLLQNLIQKTESISSAKFFPPIFFALVALVSYALFIPWLGFYGDDWSYIWLLFKTKDITPFFENNRVILAFFYKLIAPLLGPIPWHWQVSSLLMRWTSVTCLYYLILKLYPQNRSRAMWVSLVFLVYPGFYLQYNAVTFMVVFFMLSLFILSLYLTIHAVQEKKYKFLFHTFALIFSFLNLVSMEYFYLLELLRLPFIWIGLPVTLTKKEKINKVGRISIPYLVIFISISVWRVLNQSQITHQYRFSLLENFKLNPSNTLIVLWNQIFHDFFQSTFGVWWQSIILPERSILNPLLTVIHWLLVGGSVIVLFILLSRLNIVDGKARFNVSPLLWFGLAAFILGGVPVWLTGLQPDKDYSTTRLYLPFLLGAVFIFIGCIETIPVKYIYKSLILSTAIGLAVGTQFTFANFFRQDWVLQRDFYWQLAWRIPELSPGTTILADRLPSRNGEENAQSAAINYMYAQNPQPGLVDYYIYFIPERIEQIPELFEPGTDLMIPHLIGTFVGTSDKLIGIHLDERNCIRLMNPDLDSKKSGLSPFFRRLSKQIDNESIILNPKSPNKILSKDVFGSEPEHNWCYYYQQAEIAGQSGDWESAASIAIKILGMDESLPDLGKNALFMEAFARTGNWPAMNELISRLMDENHSNQPGLCVLLSYLQDQEISDPGRNIPASSQQLDCP